MRLQGSEIKSIRAGHISLAESYIRIDGHEAWLEDAHIAPYEQASINNHDSRGPRKLLLHRDEIEKLWTNVRQKGVTVIPLKVYLKEGRAKMEIALAKGKSFTINEPRSPSAMPPGKLNANTTAA